MDAARATMRRERIILTEVVGVRRDVGGMGYLTIGKGHIGFIL
jgi:hypothetical protein